MTELTAEHKSWRLKIFAATWLSYVGFYFCRKPFSAAKAAIGLETGWNATTLGNIWAAYLVAYALGQFVAAGLGTRFGPRKNVLVGMAISILVTLAMGMTLSVTFMAGLVAFNGLAQATGWSGNVGTMAAWFRKSERGRVMGAWANCFTIGALTSGWAMAAVLDRHGPGEPSPWRACFYVGAATLGAIWVFFFFFQRNNPESAGLSPIEDPPARDAGATASAETKGLGLSRSAWVNLLLVAGFYFFAKFIRYAVWSWAAYFLQKNYHLTGARANVYATAFDLLGIPGIYLTGWLSDRFFGSRRAGISVIMMIAMTIATALLMTLGSTSVAVFAVLLGLVGFTLYGPDALLTSAGAIDIGTKRAAVFTTAIISGFGSLGAIVQELVIARAYDAKKGELGPIFEMLFGSAALATLFCIVLVLRDRRGRRGV
ncbi:MAG: MFS transporter [Deltaproteobacteria bacterium]|nr:MFS transporter [Deltaproteobacteria bacterium]